MKIDFDPAKTERNIRERKLSFERARDVDRVGAVVKEDDRNPYPEQRFVALGRMGQRLHVLCFVVVPGGIRVISFRKANEREVKSCDRAIASNR